MQMRFDRGHKGAQRHNEVPQFDKINGGMHREDLSVRSQGWVRTGSSSEGSLSERLRAGLIAYLFMIGIQLKGKPSC